MERLIMRTIFKKDYIIDTAGFVLDKDGNILPTFINTADEVFITIDNLRYYLEDLIEGYEINYKNVKYLKSKEVWSTYVVCSAFKINDNKSFKKLEDAANHVNKLYTKYNLDRIPNIIPTFVDTPQYDVDEGDYYTVFLSGSIKSKSLPQDVKDYTDYLIEHRELQDRLQFVVGDCMGYDVVFQKYLDSWDFEDVIVVHMGDKPRYNPCNFETYEVEVPMDTPYKSVREYQTFKDEFACDNCDELIIVCKDKSAGSLRNATHGKTMGLPVFLKEI